MSSFQHKVLTAKNVFSHLSQELCLPHLCLQLREEPVPVLWVMSIPRVFHESPAVVGPGCLHTKVTPSGSQVSLGTDQLCWEALGRGGHLGQPWFVVLLPQLCLRTPQALGQKMQHGQASGLRKRRAKYQKTNPFLWLLLLMRNRTLPEPEGTEGG